MGSGGHINFSSLFGAAECHFKVSAHCIALCVALLVLVIVLGFISFISLLILAQFQFQLDD